MSVEIYLFITLGFVVGIILRRGKVRVGRFIDACLSGVIYCLVFLVGLNFGKVSTHPETGEVGNHQALSIIQVGLAALMLAVAPALFSLLLATILIREKT